MAGKSNPSPNFLRLVFSTDAEPGFQVTQKGFIVLFTTGTGSTVPIYNAE